MNAQKSTLVWGSDPEFFAGYKKDGEYFVLPPAFLRVYRDVPFVPDPKHPVFLDAFNDLGVIIMEDGVAFEETVIPDTNWKNLFDRIQIGKKLLSDKILSLFKDDCEPDVLSVPTINYDVKRWMSESPEFKMCLIFGCDRDYDAFNNNQAGRTTNALKHPFRYGGGHIHVSGSSAIKEEPILAIQSLALTAGLAAVAFSDTPDLDKSRTFLYGRPGKYRAQKYSGLFKDIPNTDFGVEYRTPSNRWTHSFEHAENVFKWAEIGIRNLLEQGLGLELIDKIGKDVCDSIVNCDQVKAKELLSYVETRL